MLHLVTLSNYPGRLHVAGVDGICGSGQAKQSKTGGVENAGVDISARYDKGGHAMSSVCLSVCLSICV